MGYHRAGIPPDTPECTHLINELLRAEAAGSCDFLGLVSNLLGMKEVIHSSSI